MSEPEPRPSGARYVALGILASKVFGLVRENVLARFFGVGLHNDILRNALRAPNVLQNLLGEQALSAAFIPIYSRLLAEGRRDEARRFAGAVFGLLAASVSLLVILGMWLAPWIVAVLAAGFLDDAAKVAAGEMAFDRYPRTVQAVRIIFPMTGFLVLSAWALGVLNSHRRFLLPYVAPAIWNVSIVTVLVTVVHRSGFLGAPADAGLETVDRWLFAACWGALLGGALQFAVQLPLVLRLLGGLRPSLSLRVPGVREALAMVGPAIAGRGVVQLSLYLDLFLANFLRGGAPSALGFAAVLFNLPLSAFGMSIAAAELPELSSEDPEGAAERIGRRIDRALRQAAFVLCPAVVGYLLFGLLAASLLFGGGRFTTEDGVLVAAVLAGYTLGLLASTASRLLQNTFFALRDTRTPARIAVVRLASSATVGAALMFYFDRFRVADVAGLEGASGELYFGAVGLSLASSLGAWAELAFLRRAVRRRLPGLRLPVAYVARRLGLAVLVALPALALWALVADWSLRLQGLVVLPVYAAIYLAIAWWRRTPELELWLGRIRRR